MNQQQRPQAATSAQQQQQQHARTSSATPTTSNRTILDELLALGQLQGPSSVGGLLAEPEKQPNVTIIDYRQVAGPWHAPQESVTPFEEFQSQWRSMAAAAATAATDSASSSTTTPRGTLALAHPLANAANGAGPQTVQILDIRRTKTARRRRSRRGCAGADDQGPPLAGDLNSSASSSSGDAEEQQQAASGETTPEVRHTNTSRSQTHGNTRQQQQSTGGNQRQQSGETLSSFESDYDLLLYLGETETEDLVDTERSLDYLDQTWRQSICGGASLAPTLDESFSDVLAGQQHPLYQHPHQQQQHLSPHDEFELLWRPPSGSGGGLAANSSLGRRPQLQNQQQQRARVTSNQNNLSPPVPGGSHSSASLPRAGFSDGGGGDLNARLPQTRAQPAPSTSRTLQPRGAQTSGAQEPAEAATLQQKQQQINQPQAGTLADKFASLFGRQHPHQQQQRLHDGSKDKQPLDEQTTRQLDELLEFRTRGGGAGGQQMMAPPPKPKRQVRAQEGNYYAPSASGRGGADELDRLLAEMSQSLDLDSLARYDPHREGRTPVAAVAAPSPQTQAPVSHRNLQAATISTHKAPQQQQQHVKHIATSPQMKLYENQDTHEQQQQQQPGEKPSSESILSDYDGASRMLEQMISDQLAEALGTTAAPPPPPPAQQQTPPPQQQQQRRKLSTGSSSLATSTQESVVLRGGGGGASRPPEEPTYSNQSVMWRHSQAAAQRRRLPTQSESNIVAVAGQAPDELMAVVGERKTRPQQQQPNKPSHLRYQLLTNYSRSLDVPAEQAAAMHTKLPPAAAPAAGTQKILSVRRESPPRRRSSPSQAKPLTDPPTPSPPPPPPGAQVIQVEAAEISLSSSSSEDETGSKPQAEGSPHDTKRHRRMINRMRRRTLTSMRSMRDKFSQLGGGGPKQPQAAVMSGQVEPPAEAPEPPKRSSSIASSSAERLRARSAGLTTRGANQGAEVGVAPADASPRQSRQRERHAAPAAAGPPPAAEAPGRDPENPHLVPSAQVKSQPGGGSSGDKKSLGRQWRERLSRSKSRFRQFLSGGDSGGGARKRARSTPGERTATPGPSGRGDRRAILPQPSDIARNEPNPRESSLERHLQASLVSDMAPPHPPPPTRNVATSMRARKISTTSSNKSVVSSDLSGLETTTTPRRRRRPASLMSLKRFSESFGRAQPAAAAATGDPESELEAQGAKRRKRAANKRQRNKSTGATTDDLAPGAGTAQLLSPKRATTDDYFGLVAPLRTPADLPERATPTSSVHMRVEMGPRVRPASALLAEPEDGRGGSGGGGEEAERPRFAFRRNRKLPKRSQSLKAPADSPAAAARAQGGSRSVAGTRDSCGEVDSKLPKHQQQQQQQKAVSFQNLTDTPTGAAHQRRQLSPVAPNTFRPASAAATADTPTTAVAAAGDATPPTTTLAGTLNLAAADLHRTDHSPVTPVRPSAPAAASTRSTLEDSRVSSRASGTKSPMRERGATLLGDLKSKYNELFRARAPSGDPAAAAAGLPPRPHRPPRRRRQRAAHEGVEEGSAQSAPPRRAKSLAARWKGEDGERDVIELAPASPPLSLGATLTPSESPQPGGGAPPSSKAKRLASFAQQLRTSAVDFFNAPPGQRRARPTSGGGGKRSGGVAALSSEDHKPPTTTTTTNSTVDCGARQFATRNSEEPEDTTALAQWRPIIPTTGGRHRRARSASFRLAQGAHRALKGPQTQDRRQADAMRGHTLAGGELGVDRQKSLDDTDSTWDSNSSSSSDEDAREQERATPIVHEERAQIDQPALACDESSSSPSQRQRRRPATTSAEQEQQQQHQQQQVCAEPALAPVPASASAAAAEAKAAAAAAAIEAAKGGTLSQPSVAGKLPGSILQEQQQKQQQLQGGDKSASSERQQVAVGGAAAAAGTFGEQKRELAAARDTNIISSSSSGRNDQNNNTTPPGTADESAPVIGREPQRMRETHQTADDPPSPPSSTGHDESSLPQANKATVAAATALGHVQQQLFKFKDILPSPEQIREETRWRQRREQQEAAAAAAAASGGAHQVTPTGEPARRRRPTPIARSPGMSLVAAVETQPPPQKAGPEETGPKATNSESENSHSNRLSIYENVEQPPTPAPITQVHTNEEPQQVATRTTNAPKQQQQQETHTSAKQQAAQVDRLRVALTETKILNSTKQAEMTRRDLSSTPGASENGTPAAVAVPSASSSSSSGDTNGSSKRAETEADTAADWSVEPDQLLVERMERQEAQRAAASAARSQSPGELQQHQQRQERPPSATIVATTKRKLISMTSIIQEPEDELMNYQPASSADQQQQQQQQVVDLSWPPRVGQEQSQTQEEEQQQQQWPARAQEPRRYSGLFEARNDSDDSDSSLAPPAASGRKRLLDKLRGQQQQAAAAGPAAEPPKRPPNLPRAGGGSGSLVKRLARNFDQTVQEQPAALGSLGARRSPVAAPSSSGGSSASKWTPATTSQQPPVAAGARPAAPPLRPEALARLSFELDEPKSDSTWYDAKSAELLDEAEVAELLREFENEGRGAEHPQLAAAAGEAGDSTTLSEDNQLGRKEDPEAAGPLADNADSDATLNDDQTLDEDADDQEPLPADGGESPSVYESLATDGAPQRPAQESAAGAEAAAAAGAAGKGNETRDLRSDAAPVACNLIGGDRAAAATSSNACPAGVNARTSSATAVAAARDERVACASASSSPTEASVVPHAATTPTAAAAATSAVAAAPSPTSSGDTVACCARAAPSAVFAGARALPLASDNNNKSRLSPQPQHPQSPPLQPPLSPPSPLPPSVETTADERPQVLTPELHLIDHHHTTQQQFKQSLSQIISRSRPASSAAADQSCGPAGMRVGATGAGGGEGPPPPLVNSEERPDLKKDGNKQQLKSTAAHKGKPRCKKASALAKEISKCYKALVGASDLAAKATKGAKHHHPRPADIVRTTTALGAPQQVVAASQSERRDSVQSSEETNRTGETENSEQQQQPLSSGSESELEDEQEFQLNTKNLVHAAKQCSQLYEELERLLQIRSAKQQQQQRLDSADSLTSKPQVDKSVGPEQAEDREDDEESLLADLCLSEQSSQRDDVISLSSSSLSSESLPELRQRKNLQKLYNIVNEICTSEEKFVATLRLLNEHFRAHVTDPSRWVGARATTNSSAANSNSSDSVAAALHAHTYKVNLAQGPFECLGLAFKHLPQLQALNENLLGELKRAREQWPSTQRISHVLVKIGPFLKHYSSYIRDFELIQQQFQENLKKSSHFRLAIHSFEGEVPNSRSGNGGGGKLSVQHHLLKPIQRIPQYRLLLQQYLHHLKPDDADYEDTVEALEVVSRVAEHANASLSEGANFAKLLALQAKVVGKQRDIVQPGRLFVKEGELLKVCRKQIQPCWFVLLNDALLYLKQIQSSDILYLKYELPLDDCQVDLVSANDDEKSTTTTPTGEEEPQQAPAASADTKSKDTNQQQQQELLRERQFNVCTTVRSMTLIAKSRQERDEWLAAMRAAIGDQVAKRQSFKSASSKCKSRAAAHAADCASGAQEQANFAEEEQDQGDALQELIGRKAPIWTPDARVTRCESCTSNFSALFRRHHCRACGRVVCSACSSNKAPLIYLKCRAARVCDSCFESLRANMHLYYLPSCPINERDLRRLDEHFKSLLKAQFTRERPHHHRHQHKHKATAAARPQHPPQDISPGAHAAAVDITPPAAATEIAHK